MKHVALGLFAALLAGACVHSGAMDQVHAGMSHDEVSALIGQPDGTANTAGRQCEHYTVLKDFWRRVPWDMSEPYYVCYSEDGKVDTFGLARPAKLSGL